MVGFTVEQIEQVRGSVLVVDDNPLILNVVRGLLKSEHYDVVAACDGQEALQLLQGHEVDVIICDVMMPAMDGYELHRKVREQATLSHIPFVFLTALDDQSERNRGREVGADDYLTKPFDPQELLAVVKGKIARARGLKAVSEERYDSYRKKVIHTLSHEFRTPLVAINTGAELLLEQHDNINVDRLRGLIEAIRRGGLRLERLVNDFMLLQQIEAGIANRLVETRHQICRVTSLLAQCQQLCEPQLAQEGFRYSFVPCADTIEVDVYEPHIIDIVQRLVSNSLKFSKEVKEVDVVTLAQDPEIYFEVRDRGIGIDLDKVNEALNIFGQINREKLEQQGGGLGLAIAGRYAMLNRGRIEFERRPEGGTIGRLVLPIFKRT